MADIQTSVVITAQTDDLQSGMEAAASSVQTATQAMRAQLMSLGAGAQQAQSRIGNAAAQIGSTLGALKANAASLAGTLGGNVIPNATAAAGGGPGHGMTGTQQASPIKGMSFTYVGSGGSTGASGGGGQDRVGEWREELQQQLEAENSFFGDSKAEELKFWQDKLALTQAGSKARLAVETQVYNLEKQLAVENERDELSKLTAAQQVDDAIYQRKKAEIDSERELGNVSATDALAQQQALLDGKWAFDQEYYEKKLAAAQGDAKTQDQVDNQELVAYQNYLTEKAALDEQAAKASQDAWSKSITPIEDQFAKLATDVVMQTKTIQQAFDDLVKSLLTDTLNSAFKSLFNAILGPGLGGGSGSGGGSGGLLGSALDPLLGGLFGKGISGLIGNPFAAGGGGLLGGSLAGLFGGGAEDAWGGIGAASSSAAGGLFGGIGGLFTGLFGLLGFEHGGIVPSAAGGWTVPQLGSGGVLAQLHSQEMVLPAGISSGLQGMIANGGGGHTFNIGVNAVDAGSVARLFSSNGSALVQALNTALRHGSALYQS